MKYLFATFLVAMSTLTAGPINRDAKVYVAGHRGLVGSAIMRKLESEGFTNIVTRSHDELDLTCQMAVHRFFAEERPDYVFLAAAKVGGIGANSTYPAEFIYENLMIEANVIHAAYKNDVTKLLFLGSSCIYPRNCPQPIEESYLLSSSLEPTNKPYAIAKISGIELCESYNRQYGTNFITCMPTNLYGPGDNFDLENSHVMPALISKFTAAKRDNLPSVMLWGDGSAMREFLHVDDLADATLFLMENYNENSTINVGTGEDITIGQLAEVIKEFSGFEGRLVYDTTKPNGTPRKVLNTSKIRALGWSPKISFRDGVANTIAWYLDNYEDARQ